ncbi:5976_t:CDS:2, partial [Paraglomus brasilianum]
MPDSGEKNWPPFRPVIRHDIEADILLDEAQALAKRSYIIFLFYYVALLGNLAAMIAQEITYKNVKFGIVLGIIYLLIVPPLDFFARHYSLYIGLKNDSKISFRWFFVIQAFDILFGIFILVGWSYGGGGGINALVYSFKDKHYVAGAFSALCVILISIQLFLSFKLWVDAYKYFKEKGWKLLPG